MRKSASEMNKVWNTKDLEVGATLEGLFVNKAKVTTKFGENEKYTIEIDGGEHMDVFSCASLKRQFDNLPMGCYVWITYKGEETSKQGFKVKIYSVDYDDEV